jgi:hypothetical protein
MSRQDHRSGDCASRKEIVANVTDSGIMVPSSENNTPTLFKRPLKE